MDTLIEHNSSLASGTTNSPGSDQHVVPVILCGGAGTRLWPVSRESFPKQFWPLASERSLVEETARRSAGPGFAAPWVICNQEHRFLVAEHLRSAGIDDARIVLEPVGRNSAPAIAAVALLQAEIDPHAILWIMAADAVIGDSDAQRRALASAVTAARSGRIVTFGMTPTSPETGYGYIEIGDRLDGHDDVSHLASFIEKPDTSTATMLLSSGRYLWNCGMFVCSAATILAELATYAPDVLEAVEPAVRGRWADLDFIRLEPTAFSAAPNISIDYAVAERTACAAVVKADMGWSDIGSWGALWEIGDKDAKGNVAVGDVLLEGAQGCYVRSDGILTAVIGLQDIVTVVTEDAVLVMDRNRTQDVKKVVDRLRRANRPQAVAHNRMYRPWGFYESLIQGERFQVKRIVVTPGQKLSLQKHYHRAEHWVVVAGSAIVTRDTETFMVRENESIYLPLGCVHRLENPGRIPLMLIEVQSGSYLGEDDIVRLEDNYGRGPQTLPT
jgi:mannose-1-phosphate guanylyltransferase/mannose-6-phosphate isomerase